MRLKFPLLIATTTCALVLSACNKVEEAAATDAAQETGADTGAAGPRIGGAVAPGVAFNYRYAFTLPAPAIAKAQQEHAAACEKLGSARCRVTTMSYDKQHENEVQARIEFLLAPDLAHRFGSDGVSAVEALEGKLESATIDGENAGGAIRLSQQNSAAIEAEIKRIEERLSLGGLSKGERIELQKQIADLREQLRGEVVTRRAKEAAIASTPVTFDYESQGLLGSSNTFGKAASASWGSAQTALSFLLLIAGIALPWLLLAGLLALAWRGIRSRRTPATQPPAGPVA